MRTAPSGKRLGYVDGLRALAALYVVLSHTAAHVWPTDFFPASWAGVTRFTTNYFGLGGHAAVSVFIVLSGYSLMLPVARNNNRLPWGAWGFYWRRARRILPTYYIALAINLLGYVGLWVLGLGTLWSLHDLLVMLAQYLFLAQDFSDLTINPAYHISWSVALECQIYVLFPLLLVLWRRYHALFVTLILVFGSAALYLILLETWIGQLPQYGFANVAPQYIGLFACGMLAATYSTHQQTHPILRWLSHWHIWDFVGMSTLILLVRAQAALPLIALDGITGIMTISILLAASHRFSLFRLLLEWRPLVWLGSFSYSIYLMHYLVILVLWDGFFSTRLWGDGTWTYFAFVLTGIPLVILLAHVFWRFCERPFLNTVPSSRSQKEAPDSGSHQGSGAMRVSAE